MAKVLNGNYRKKHPPSTTFYQLPTKIRIGTEEEKENVKL